MPRHIEAAPALSASDAASLQSGQAAAMRRDEHGEQDHHGGDANGRFHRPHLTRIGPGG